MKRRISMLLAVCAMLTAFSLPAHAAEYTFDAPDAGLFCRPTSDDTIYVGTGERVNIDRSKNVALVPPVFGEGYTAGYTVPLSSQVTQLPNVSVTGGSAVGSGVTVLPTAPQTSTWVPTAYTYVTSDLYYSAGHIGTLKIPAIDLTVKVYEGTDEKTLAKGAGHFANTSVWDGNVAFAAHNRGVTNHFGKIHTLSIGDKITYTTKLGTRTYKVYSVSKISRDDLTWLAADSENIVTLITCVMNEPEYRWVVRAKS